MSLYSNRKRERQAADREAAGESLWRGSFDAVARERIAAHWEWLIEHDDEWDSHLDPEYVEKRLRREGGWQGNRRLDPMALRESALTSDDEVLDVLECLANARSGDLANMITSALGVILREHRIGYRFVERQIVPVASDELHAEVVAPALQLLIAVDFRGAHDAYLKALREIANGDAGDAITDAGTALQETLVALGCDGNALGPLMRDAKKRGLLAPHDSVLQTGIESFIKWTSADRSSTGDAHNHTNASLPDAWLMVHVVGALIVRLADPRKNGRGLS